jgi:two-component system, LuxR family, sensor kinase FixL
MSWVTVIWAMIASACLTLALVHGLVWWRRREAQANLLFALTAFAAAVFAGCELWIMRAETPDAFGMAVRWAHVPATVLIVSLVGFVRLYLRAGRLWLAWMVCGVRTLSLILDFVFTPNLNYREIKALRHVSYLGELIVAPVGVPSPWMLISQLGLLLLVIFVADASIVVWRRGDRRQALSVGGSIVLFVVAATGQLILTLWGILHAPITVSLFFMGIVAAMGLELSRDVLRAARLSDDLRESQERMALATHALNLGIWVRDLVRNEVWATEKWRELLGFAKSERIDLDSFLQKLHPEDREAVNQALAQALGDAGGYETEYRVVLPDGQVRWIASRGRVEFNGAGKPILMRGVSLDITARKQVEEELFRARKLESLGVLAGGIAHDFNNFLTIIAGNIALAKIHLKPADSVSDILEQAAVASNRATSLALQLLTFGKGGAPVRRPSPLDGVIKDAVDLARAGAAVTINLEIASDLWSAEIDIEQIGQALYNILLNARQAMPEGGIIEVRARNVFDADPLSLRNGGCVLISVRDHGCGIEADVLPRIFDPYFTTKQSGSGLGLATAHAIIAKHEGRITVHSIPGAETTFSIYLPACKAAQTAASGVGQQLQTGSGRILVMDDEEALRLLLAQLLKHLGYEVECARDGTEAIDLYQKAKDSGRRFDIVLVDLTIPGGMGGKEVAARLREVDDSVILIVSSGYSNTPIMSEFRKYGFDDVLSKPWSPVHLSEMLRRHTRPLGKSKLQLENE